MRTSRLLLTAAAAAAMTLPASGALAAPGDDVACGDILTSDTTLTRDVVCPNGNGLTLRAGADLDLGGHRLVGPGPESGTGVTVEAGQGSSVTNGSIERWGTGLGPELPFGPDVAGRVRGVTFRDNDTGVRNPYQGFVVESSQFVRNRAGISSSFATVTVRGSAFVENDTAASVSFGGAGFEDSSFLRNGTAIDCLNVRLTVQRSTFTRNGSGVQAFECDGIQVSDSAFTHHDRAYGSLVGGGDVLLRNTFVNNDVAFDGLSSADLTENVFTGNATAVRAPADNPPGGPAFLSLTRNRFVRNGDAIVLEGRSELHGNVAIANRGYGIFAPQAVDLGGNVAFRNGREPQCTGVICSGP
jgi:hypothetical protein